MSDPGLPPGVTEGMIPGCRPKDEELVFRVKLDFKICTTVGEYEDACRGILSEDIEGQVLQAFKDYMKEREGRRIDQKIDEYMERELERKRK